ncbi:hypothetical protein EAX61_09760 [Dokdonia sinensis]|uniref:Nuclear transport factor 2 family protein n=1 Tax=Dokdonia sinensis TaxID=2479847 RepID=A0A3M0G378_9FLAO|nr:hypothetical protein [Dokdonia sinensis]RMB58617.1 hypothetical protein EAX61_09760 [Dokdonia sinensis]
MRQSLFLITALCIMLGCQQRTLSPEDAVTQYYNGFASGDYNEVKSVIDDSITLVAGDYVMPFSKESYYEQFKWDSIFQPKYELVSIEKQNDDIIATTTLSTIKHKFLKNDPMSCSYKISFKEGAISRIQELNCPDADWKTWAQRRDSLLSWINQNHPELDGFINDLTMRGAQNYLKAIDLYTTRKNTLQNKPL